MSRAAVIGGGLAGLAAAVRLAQRGFAVTILESRQRLGGRAGSFTDPATGQLIDACQHAAMGCCTEFFKFCRTVGIAKQLERQPKLHFLTADGRRSVFKSDPWPAPFHLGRALMGAHYLLPAEKLRVGWGLLCMFREKPDIDPPLLPWLKAHGQTPRTIARFWATVLVSALNETVDRLGFKYARKVFVEGFMSTRDGFEVWLPTVPLGRLYGEELLTWFERYGVDVRLNAAVKRIHGGDSGVSHLELRDGSEVHADQYVCAVPFERAAELLPGGWASSAGANFDPPDGSLETSPITSVHLWFDRPVMNLPHAVLVDCLGHWAFDRGGGYVQVVISATRDLDRTNLAERITAELCTLFPAARSAELLRSKVVTEHTATFSAVPGVDTLRPPQRTAIRNLFLAGDWTQTGWPATMEGAVRSGFLAADVAAG